MPTLLCLFIVDEYYNEDSEKKGIAEIIVDKQRNGSTGSVELVWLGQYTKFGNKERAPHLIFGCFSYMYNWIKYTNKTKFYNFKTRSNDVIE